MGLGEDGLFQGRLTVTVGGAGVDSLLAVVFGHVD